tara:strand:+ start:10113 stop:10328 length:216 start_codon:yes stop_codon:yes gene_type:complete
MTENKIVTKPIDDVRNTLHSINRNINQLKTDVICIKSDLSIIKDYIRKIEKEEKEKIEREEALKNGWWFAS